MKTQRIWLVSMVSATLGAVAVIAVWFAWALMSDTSVCSRCVTVTVKAVDFLQSYSSIEDLSADSDVVVLGTVREIAENELDRRSIRLFNERFPYTIYRVEVVEVLIGQVDSNSDIYVMRSNPDEYPKERLTRLEIGETSVFYLAEVQASEVTLTIAAAEFFFVPLQFDVAVFDISPSVKTDAGKRIVDDVIVVPRGTGPEAFPRGTTFTMAEIRAAAEGARDVGTVGNAQ